MATTTISTSSSVGGYTNICPDGHACDNDSTCVESILQERKFVCDCRDAYEQTGRVFAGLSCQHAATQYCTLTGELSHTLFCVNEGSCHNKVGVNDAHPGCQCPTGYSGAHCEYVSGSTPRETSYFLDGTTYANMMISGNNKNYNEDERPINPAAIVMPILATACLAIGLVLYKYRRMHLQGHVTDKSKQPDVNMLEADGSASMADIMARKNANSILGRRNSTPTFSSTHKAALMEPPDFEDLLEQSDHVHFHKDYTGSRTHKLFASDPTLNYTPTMETTGSGSPTYTESSGSHYDHDDDDDDLEESDINDASSPHSFQDVTSPTFERNQARVLAAMTSPRSRDIVEQSEDDTFDEYDPKDFLPGNDPTFL